VSLTFELLPVTTLKTLLTIFGGAIISCRILGSVVSGKPLSIISSNSYINKNKQINFTPKQNNKSKWGLEKPASTQATFSEQTLQGQRVKSRRKVCSIETSD
jgi:hypothetical protein